MHPSIRRFLTIVFQWISFSNGYIALCAVVMCQTTVRLFGLRLPASFLPFVFVGTLGSYSLHWFLTGSQTKVLPTDRSRWNEHHKQALLFLFLGSALAGLWLLTRLESYLPDLLPVLFLTFLYTAPKINLRPFRALRRISVLKTAYLALVWAYMTAIVPLLIATPDQLSWGLAGVWFLNRFFLIYGIALWFDYRDRADDRQSKWLTIVSMLTDKQVRIFFYSIAACFALTIIALHLYGLAPWTIVCLSLPMLLLILTAQLISQQTSDYWYYYYLDGLLMLSGLLLPFIP